MRLEGQYAELDRERLETFKDLIETSRDVVPVIRLLSTRSQVVTAFRQIAARATCGLAIELFVRFPKIWTAQKPLQSSCAA